jgi:uncharacterized protein (TIGR03083 family)
VQISPRYGAHPIITLDGAAADQRDTVIGQRRRLEAALRSMTEEEWCSPSRCEGWSVQDVVAHLADTNAFWRASISSALAGAPTRLLEGFDPKATPAALVEAMRGATAAETLARFAKSNQVLCDLLAGLDERGWSTMAEAPPGHLPIRLVAHHALWDAWVHERDILLPLDIRPEEDPNEVAACLRYAAALVASFAVMLHPADAATLVVEATDPALRIVVDIGTVVVVGDDPGAVGSVVLRGDAVDLVEMLSVRKPLDAQVAEEHRSLLSGLAEVFEQAQPA